MTLEIAFQLLDLIPTFKKPIIKKAYLEQVKIFHPDRIKHTQKEIDDKRIYEINEAYNFIVRSIENEESKIWINEASQEFKVEYESVSKIDQTNYDSNNEDIIDVLFSNKKTGDNQIKVEQVFISEKEARKGLNKKIVDKDTNEKFILEIRPDVIDGEIIIKNTNCYEIKIEK